MGLSQSMVTVRTLQHLRTSQLLWRLRYLLERRFRPQVRRPAIRPMIDPAAVPRVPVFRQLGPGPLPTLAHAEVRAFEFLNQRHQVFFDRDEHCRGPITSGNRLWDITLQYHSWLLDLAQAARIEARAFQVIHAVISEWIDAAEDSSSPLPFAWNSYAIATRAGWWTRSFQELGAEWFRRNRELAQRMSASLFRQVQYLESHVEWDLRGNHVLRDAVGLAWGGRLFSGTDAQRWLRKATEIALDQVAEQVLPDGSHFERTPMYHVLVMEDVLTLAMLLEDPHAKRELVSTWHKMAEYLAWLIRPDRRIPLFNDAAHEAVCDPDRMLTLGDAIGVPAVVRPASGERLFPDAGMAICHRNRWNVFFDVGHVGPDYQPGHAHADSLTFECCFDGKPMIVDPGTFGYDHDQRRSYVRGTQSHNTVCIDNTNSSEVWHIFRVGRRARPVDVEFDSRTEILRMSAAHTGYDHLQGSPRHHRSIEVNNQGEFIIRDRVSGNDVHQIEGGFLLDPAWMVHPVASGWLIVSGDKAVLATIESDCRLQLDLVRRPYYPTFGQEESACRIVWRTESPLPLDVCIRFAPH